MSAITKTRPAPGSNGNGRAADPKAAPHRRAQAAAMLLKQASEPTRLLILTMLAEGERNVTELCAELGQSQPATSHHISLLSAARLIEADRRGKNRYYSLTDAGRALAGVVASLQGGRLKAEG